MLKRIYPPSVQEEKGFQTDTWLVLMEGKLKWLLLLLRLRLMLGLVGSCTVADFLSPITKSIAPCTN
jgi:hypothetical protein